MSASGLVPLEVCKGDIKHSIQGGVQLPFGVLRLLTIYMEKTKIPVGKLNGSHHSVKKVLQIMGH